MKFDIKSNNMKIKFGHTLINKWGIKLKKQLTKKSLIELGEICLQILAENTYPEHSLSNELLEDIFNNLSTTPTTNQLAAEKAASKSFAKNINNSIRPKSSLTFQSQITALRNQYKQALIISDIFSLDVETQEAKKNVIKQILKKDVFNQIIYSADHPDPLYKKDTIKILHLKFITAVCSVIPPTQSQF